MKVLVHLDSGIDQTYLLNFLNVTDQAVFKRLLIDDSKDMVESLLEYAEETGIEKIQIAAADVKRAEREADFVVSHHGYIAERLA